MPVQDLLLDVPLAGSFVRSFLDACRPHTLSQQEQQQYSRLYEVGDKQQAPEGPLEDASQKVCQPGGGILSHAWFVRLSAVTQR